MQTVRLCKGCAEPLPVDAPEGLCPKCLVNAGLGTETNVQPVATDKARSAGFVPPQPKDLAAHFPELEIIELLGQGGMGVVYQARQRQLDRLVALKILPPEAGRDPAFAERFTREARALARLNHPNIVAVYEFGQSREFYYFIMEFVDGMNLRQLEQSRRLTPAEALAIIPKICEALQFAHDEGIVHRDKYRQSDLFADGARRPHRSRPIQPRWQNGRHGVQRPDDPGLGCRNRKGNRDSERLCRPGSYRHVQSRWPLVGDPV